MRPSPLRALTAAILATWVAASSAVPANAAEPDVIRQSEWQISSLRLTDVHKRATGAGIIVAVIDSGVDGTHPDLTGQVVQGPALSNLDLDGRGTALAGLIAGHGHASAAGGTDAGILGVAPGAKILPIAYAPIAGESGDADKLATGIELAISRGANVICIARGSATSERLQFAIEVAVLKGVLVVAADASPWPASYPGVLTAIPYDSTGDVREPSSSGRTTGISVPGESLMAPHLGGGYRQADAPAAAAATLAGSAAVVWSANPDAKADQIVQLLRRSATDSGATGPDTKFGAGKVNLIGALEKPVAVTPTPSTIAQQSAAAAAPQHKTDAKGTVNPLIHSDDWRRWVLILPLIAFFVGFAFWALHRRVKKPGR